MESFSFGSDENIRKFSSLLAEPSLEICENREIFIAVSDTSLRYAR
jgi:hypothetical protein